MIVLRTACIFLVLATAFARDKGIINLDSLTFDKIVGESHPVLVRFDKEYPYGDEHEAYKWAARNVSASVIAATVGISEWGEKENQDLADRFNVKKSDWPVYMFFPKGSQEGVTFQGDKKSTDAILRFVRNQGVWVGLTGCVEALDRLARDFITNVTQRSDILKMAESFLEDKKKNITPSFAASVKHYVSIMKKVLESGETYLQSESERLLKMIKEKSVKPDKKKNFESRSNILQSFLDALKVVAAATTK